MEITRDRDRVLLTVHFIRRPVTLSPDTPRRIRFSLVATPTKTLLPYLQKARLYDDVHVGLLPNDWSGHPCWHAPVKDAAAIAKTTKHVERCHRAGRKALVNGGWNISTDHADWQYWGKEMVAEPLQNVSWQNVKQFAACYRSPYLEFLANSFGYNAKLLKFDGIRFDTVVPGYKCESMAHGCGWHDDEGNLWPSRAIYPAREAWKRIYRAFHGGAVEEGIVYLPVAAGPVMAVHSFCDVHEIGEGYYMHAKTLKSGYPPDMVRAIKNGDVYGLRSTSNLKGGPLFANQRIAALLVHNAEPRFGDYRFWRPDYSAQGNPGSAIMDAWEWVGRWEAQFLGWWENSEYVRLGTGSSVREVYASFWLQKGRKMLLAVSNYEPEPVDELPIKLDLAKLGLTGTVYAEDAITAEPVQITDDGRLKLDVLGERYRLIKVSSEKPRYGNTQLGPSLLTIAPAETAKSWAARNIEIEPDSVYVLRAQVKIDQPMGADSKTPNHMGKWSPVIRHFVAMALAGKGITGVNASTSSALCSIKGTTKSVPYRETDFYRRNCVPKYWEPTPGWMTVFVPFGTSAETRSGAVEVRITDPGQALVRDITLQKVLR